MKKYYILLAFFLTACGGSSYPQGTPTPTPNPGELALQMVQQQVGAAATSQIVGLQFTATAHVLNTTATAQAYVTNEAITQQARFDAEATADQARRDAQATQQRIDAESTQVQARVDAQSTADQARLDLQATQTAESSATAFAMTQQVVATHEWWTVTAVEQDILLKHDKVEMSNLEVDQQTESNTWDWAYPIAVSSVMIVSFLLYVKAQSKVRVIKNGDDDVEAIIYDDDKLLTPGLMPKPILNLKTGEMPDVTNAQEQAEIVRRAQGIKALANIPVNPTGPGAQAFNQMFNDPVEKRIPTIEIVPAGQIDTGILEDIEGQVVEEG